LVIARKCIIDRRRKVTFKHRLSGGILASHLHLPSPHQPIDVATFIGDHIDKANASQHGRWQLDRINIGTWRHGAISTLHQPVLIQGNGIWVAS
jgi:hypothetical protein